MAEQYFIVYMYHICFIHSFDGGHLGCFHVLTIVNRAAMNVGVHVSFLALVSSKPKWYCLEVLLLCQMVVLFLVFKESPYCLLQWLYQSAFPPAVQKGSLFYTPTPAHGVCGYFDYGHSDWGEVISHCSSDLHFSNNE